MLIIKFAFPNLYKILLRKLAVAAIACVLMPLQVQAYVEGPIWGPPTLLGTTTFNLADVGYQQQEFFVSGQAKSYTSTSPMGSDGKWTVAVKDTAYFKTRFVVYRPIDPAKFNGTVIVEWFNVSGGTDAASEWIMAHTELIRKGYAWVGVSVQKGGVSGGGINYLGVPLPLKLLNPLRYLTLTHPGDKYAYDIFTQAAKAALNPGSGWFTPKPLGNLQVERAIAVGESQSADFMLTYVNAIAPIEQLFDGYFIHSRLHGSAGLNPQTSGSSINFTPRSTVRVRNDLGVPVMNVQTETDLFVLGSHADRQPDSANFRLWEIAGTGHADNYVANIGAADLGNDPSIAEVVENHTAVPILVNCEDPINSGPQHFVVKAAIAALNNWIRNGIAPAYAERLETTGNPATFVRDTLGNALGGIRTPYVDAPIAVLSGEGQGSEGFCSLYGSTDLFEEVTLMGLYPDHATYMAAVNTSLDNAVLQGFILQKDADLIRTWAQTSNIGNY